LNIQSFYDVSDIDLGRIGLLNESKEDAFVLTWGEKPIDLDSRLRCPNGEVVGVPNDSSDANRNVLQENFFAEVSVDTINGFGPETLTISKWTDVSLSSKYKIGGHYELYVNWYKDEN